MNYNRRISVFIINMSGYPSYYKNTLYVALVVLSLILFYVTPLTAINWSNIRHSSLTSESNIHLRYEYDSVENANHSVHYYSTDSWIEAIVSNIIGTTFESVFPFDNQQMLPLSLKIQTDEITAIICGHINNELPNSLSKMNTIAEYERNNEIPAHLNIAKESVIFSDEKIHLALTNFGGGFKIRDAPTGPFYSYSINLWHTDLEEPEYVYSLTYTINLPPFISSGLYKIDGEDESMELIGELEVYISEEENTLYLSCLFADLLVDEDFAAGYVDSKVLYTNTLTQKIENFGNLITIQDESKTNQLLFSSISIEPFINSKPEIKDIVTESYADSTVVSLYYYDAEGHFPLIAELITDNNSVYNFTAYEYDYSKPVQHFVTIKEQWDGALIRFSDNGYQLVEYELFNTSVDKPNLTPIAAVKTYPNPFVSGSSYGELNLSFDAEKGGFLNYEIINIKGQRLYKSEPISIPSGIANAQIPSVLLSSVLSKSGVYFIRIEHNKNIHTGKILYIK